uniref:Uncharacterized protein n=1 Tax=Romanomermis culicivorax TaxID=13658 RepID=A0A915I3R5_ROMCU
MNNVNMIKTKIKTAPAEIEQQTSHNQLQLVLSSTGEPGPAMYSYGLTVDHTAELADLVCNKFF